jgi:hypothetical protein
MLIWKSVHAEIQLHEWHTYPLPRFSQLRMRGSRVLGTLSIGESTRFPDLARTKQETLWRLSYTVHTTQSKQNFAAFIEW